MLPCIQNYSKHIICALLLGSGWLLFLPNEDHIIVDSIEINLEAAVRTDSEVTYNVGRRKLLKGLCTLMHVVFEMLGQRICLGTIA